MATFGVLNNATTATQYTDTAGDLWYVGANITAAGTLTLLNFYADNRAGNPAFNDFRFGIYAGGSAAGPSGATKIWDSGRITTTVGSGGMGWKTLAASGAFSAGYIWVAWLSADGLDMQTCDGANEGDFGPNTDNYVAAYSTSTALADPFPGNGSDGAGDTLKVFITYTATAATPTVIVNPMRSYRKSGRYV